MADLFAAVRPRVWLPVAVALGLVMALGQAPWGLPVLALLALVLVMALMPLRFVTGWALGAAYFGLAMHWIVQPFYVDPDRHGWMAPFALLLMAGGLALFWGAAFWAAGRWRLGRPGLVALWAGAEAARSLAFTGLPWALVGHIWVGTPLAQLAAWTGPQGLTLATLGAAALLGAPGGGWAHGPRAAVVMGLAGGWLMLDPGPVPAPDVTAPLVRVVQPNIPQADKWDEDQIPGHIDSLLTLTAQAPEGEADRPALILWPETAVPYLLEWADPLLDAAAAAAQGATLVTGIQRRDGDALYYNTLVVLRDGGTPLAMHDKSHLTPFGEYIPWGDWLGARGIHGLAANQGFGFTAGPGLRLIDLPGIGPALPLICYEGIFAEELAGVPGRARVLLIATNDGWFGTWAGPEQHLAQARLRAIEQGLPLLRSANTGISAVIDARGRVLARLDLGQAGALDARLPAALPPTAYSRSGDWPALGAMAALLTFAALRRRRPIDPAPART